MRTPNPANKTRNWPGLLLSLFVPGFGLFRAGLIKRAIFWLIGLHFLSLLSGVSLGLSTVSLFFVAFVILANVLAYLFLFRDSWRPGVMTRKLWLLFIVLLTLLVFIPSPVGLLVSGFKVPTGSMEPTLLGNNSAKKPDRVIIDRMSYHFQSPKRGDLLVFKTSTILGIQKFLQNKVDSTFIKRIIGLPGERIRISEGRVYANDKLVSEVDGIPSSIYYKEPEKLPFIPHNHINTTFEVPANEFFVLGDNSANSLDSRYWGCVPASAIYGKVSMIYYPLHRIRRIP